MTVPIPVARVVRSPVRPIWYRPGMATPAPTPPTPPTPAPPATPSSWTDPATYLHLLAVILTALLASGVIPTTGTTAQIVAIVGSILTALGYPVVRAIAQTHGATALALAQVTAQHHQLALETIRSQANMLGVLAGGGK